MVLSNPGQAAWKQCEGEEQLPKFGVICIMIYI